jgi:hypothetical protein
MLRYTSLFAAALLVGAALDAQAGQLDADRPACDTKVQPAQIRASISRDMARLVDAERLPSSTSAIVAPQRTASGGSWKRVRGVNRTDELLVTRQGGQPGRRVLVRADDADSKS